MATSWPSPSPPRGVIIRRPTASSSPSAGIDARLLALRPRRHTPPPPLRPAVQELLEITPELGLRELAGLLRHRYPLRLGDALHGDVLRRDGERADDSSS